VNVFRLKQILQNTLEILEETDDNAEIKMQTNTYFMRGVMYYVSSASEGFFDLENPLGSQDDEEDTE
jgi:hypothetical protein